MSIDLNNLPQSPIRKLTSKPYSCHSHLHLVQIWVGLTRLLPCSVLLQRSEELSALRVLDLFACLGVLCNLLACLRFKLGLATKLNGAV